MEFRIAETFQNSLAKLNNNEQKAAKTTAFDLQIGLEGNSLQFHKIAKVKDPNFWSVRVNSDIRIVVHKTDSSILLCYVDHHDAAYNWAGRRRIENHPVTGAAQIIETREFVEDVMITGHTPAETSIQADDHPTKIFHSLSHDDLSSIGVPLDWIDDILDADEDQFLNISDYLPQESAEILLEVATGTASFTQAVEMFKEPKLDEHLTGFAHPDALRRFKVIDGAEELAAALEFPWDKWAIFLHPSQRDFAEKKLSGPARVSGSAGTGKTVVAIHRAAYLYKKNPTAKILLTTFSAALAGELKRKLLILLGQNTLPPNIITLHLEGIAAQLSTSSKIPLNIASTEELTKLFEQATESLDISDFTIGFLLSEWTHVVDAWQLRTWEAYRNVKRLGRKTRVGGTQREKLWLIFDYLWAKLDSQTLTTWASVFEKLAGDKNISNWFDHVIIDEAQDISVTELRFTASLAGKKPDGIFFAGDLGQRIFRQPFSWLNLGVDIRGRSRTLNINYRTSHQIRRQADRLLPQIICDVDEFNESRNGTISLFNSDNPTLHRFDSKEDETRFVASWISSQFEAGISPEQIGIFVRSDLELKRAKSAIESANLDHHVISPKKSSEQNCVVCGTMHDAKGLEFRSVVVMACDDEVIPSQSRLEQITDESDLDEVYETERHLLYVACTRAREQLVLTCVSPGSEFLDDLFEV